MMAELPIVKAKLQCEIGHGRYIFWLVDAETLERLNTEPVCMVPRFYHEWFREWLTVNGPEIDYPGLLRPTLYKPVARKQDDA